MKFNPANFRLAAALVLVLSAPLDRAEEKNPLGAVKDMHTKNFTSESYFEPPNDQHLKMRLSGAEASPLPGGLLDISEVTIEKFDLSGKLESVVEAPQCTFSLFDHWASSPGRLKIRSGDGHYRIEGEGFLLQQTNMSLTISNRVHTVIEMSAAKAIAS